MPHISVTAAAHPDKPAYIMGNSGEVVTYRQLDERSNQVAHLLRSLGLNREVRVNLVVLKLRWVVLRSDRFVKRVGTSLEAR